MEFAAIEESAKLLDQKSVACHVCIFRVPTASAILPHQVGISIAQDEPNADLLRQPDAVHQSFVFGHIVGCSKMNLQDITELVTFGGCEHNARP